MVTKTINKLPKSQIEVQVLIPWLDIESKWNETLQKLAADLELPGFRKGQAPLNMAEANLGKKLEEEVLKVMMPQALVEALQGSNIIPIDYPKYQVVSFVKGQELNFKAAITERPQVSLEDYKNIKATRPPLKEVTEADVDKVIADLFSRWKARQTVAPSAAQATTDGNQKAKTQGSISFSGQLDPAKPQPVQIASDVPDEDFAKSLGALNLSDLKAKLKADLENEAKYNNELDYEEAILQEVEKITQVELPDVLVEDELNRMLVSLQKRVADMGLLLDDYLKGQGKTLESLKNEWRGQAERNVKMELGLSEIARAENVQVTDSEVQAEIEKIQDGRLKAQFEAQEPRMHLRHSLRQVKTLDLLKSLVTTT